MAQPGICFPQGLGLIGRERALRQVEFLQVLDLEQDWQHEGGAFGFCEAAACQRGFVLENKKV